MRFETFRIGQRKDHPKWERALKQFVFSLISLMLFLPGAHSEGGRPLSSVKQLCLVDKATGFNWRNGKWDQVNFIENKYIITKLDIPENIVKTDGLDALKSIEDRVKRHKVRNYWQCNGVYVDFIVNQDHWGNQLSENHKNYPACLRIQVIGEEMAIIYSCKEAHHKWKSGPWIVEFNCDDDVSNRDLFMRPDGYFHHSKVHNDLGVDLKENYKDSMFIEVGKCASIAD